MCTELAQETTAAEVYDVIVIGGGAAGCLAAIRAAQAGFAAALVERQALGGAFLHQNGLSIGKLLCCPEQPADQLFARARGSTAKHTARLPSDITVQKRYGAKRITYSLKAILQANDIALYFENAKLLGRNADGQYAVLCGERTLFAKRLILAVGAREILPEIPGLTDALEAGFAMTEETAAKTHEQPQTVCLIGSSAACFETACQYAASGINVTILDRSQKPAASMEQECRSYLLEVCKKHGISVQSDAIVVEIAGKTVCYEKSGRLYHLLCDRVVLFAQRRPNTRELGLETIEIQTKNDAIYTDLAMRTSAPHVYAVGDCNGKHMRLHAACREAEVAVNHIRGVKDMINYQMVPVVLHTEPEFAYVGLWESEAQATRHSIKTARVPMALSHRYIAENRWGKDYCKLVYDATQDRLVGVQVTGCCAAELISIAAVLLQLALPLEQMKKLTPPYASLSEVLHEGLFLL